MIKYDKKTNKQGITKTQVRVSTEIKQSNGKYSKITIKNFGYLEGNENQDEFIEMVKKFDKEYREGKNYFLISWVKK